MKKKLFYIVTVDWFFKSHRFELALSAKEKGYEVYLLARDTGKFNELRSQGINCINIPFIRSFGNPLNVMKVLFLLLYYVWKFQPKVVHYIAMKPIIYGTILHLFNPSKRKYIFSVTGVGFIFQRRILELVTRYLMFIVFFIRNRSTYFVFQNKIDLQFFSEKILNVNVSKYLIKGSGVDESYFCPNLLPRENSDKVRVTLVSRLLKDKGVIEFIDAATLLYPEFNGEVIFRLVGDVDNENPNSLSSDYIAQMMIPDYLEWAGYQTDIREVYANTDIACLPSYREGLPKSLVEAMAMKCAILTTNVAGCSEVVDNGMNGYLVEVRSTSDLKEKLIQLIRLQKNQLISMGNHSRKKMKKEMTLDYVIDKTISIYDN